MVSTRHDYILCYGKNVSSSDNLIRLLPMDQQALSRYKNQDNDPRGLWKSDPATAQAGHGTKNQFYTLIAPNGKRHECPSGRCWIYTEDVMNEAIADGRIWFGEHGNNVPRVKTYLEAKDRGLTPETIWFADDVSTNESAKNDLKLLFDGEMPFETPKPVQLIDHILRVCTSDDDIVLDSFAGSGTTAHAVLNLNAQDGGRRRFVLVEMMTTRRP
jgi:Adenine specific DNA methylase Mod